MADLLSVGIDIGTTTTQLIFSKIKMENTTGYFAVPRISIVDKEILYQSEVHLTPLLTETLIDSDGVREIVAQEYQKAGIVPSSVDTGAVIITGETARKENAREVLEALAGFAGDFVVATAGPALESILAGKGAGAERVSAERRCAVLNLDIGGGTTNLALFENGALRDTGCLNVGGRLMKFAPDGALTYLSPVLAPFFPFRIGQRLSERELEPVTELLVRVLEQAVGCAPAGEELKHFITDKTVALTEPPLLSFSGGVADLIDDRAREPFAYGDLGVLLGRAIFRSRLCSGSFLRASETIRATVIGAGSHATTLSGSTIYFSEVDFPLKTLPVAALSADEETLAAEELARHIRRRIETVSPEEHRAALALHGRRNIRFAELCKLADGLAQGLADCPEPLVIAVEEDMGKALGQAVGTLLAGKRLVCLDGVRLSDGAYLDIGAPVAEGQALPVVIKTLIL